MSYGDIDNVVEFHPGLIYLSAPNGYGKSTIVEALTYVLYGKSYRGGNQSDLKNTENKNADMVVTLDFDVDTGTGKHEYHIERRMKAKSLKTSFTIWVNGEEQLKRAGMSQQDFENQYSARLSYCTRPRLHRTVRRLFRCLKCLPTRCVSSLKTPFRFPPKSGRMPTTRFLATQHAVRYC